MQDRQTLQALLEGIGRYGDKPALIALASGARWSFAELDDRVRRLAAGLAAQGVGRGERVGILAPNGAEWVAAALALIVGGAAPVPLDGMMPQEDLAHAIRDSGARRIFTTSDRAGSLRAIMGEDLDILLLDGGEAAGGRDRASLPAAPPAAPPRLGPEDVAAHFYTSGTSGRPKGVPLTHRNIAANVTALLDEGLVAPDERVCLPLPLFHVYPFVVGMLTPLAAGATLILPAGISGPEIARALRDGRATAMIGVPRLYDALLAAIRSRAAGRPVVGAAFGRLLILSAWMRRRHGWRLGSRLLAPVRRAAAPDLRLLVSGGAKLEPELAYALEGLGWEVLSGYGLTETSPIITFNRRGRARLGTAGQPLPGVALRIAEPDEDGVGEVVVRGPNVFHGYHNLPEKTAEVLSPDGWFRTDDLGRLDAEGYLLLSGRRSAVIVLPGGKKLDPEAVEASYAESPAIREIGVLLLDGRLVAVLRPASDEGGAEAAAAAIRGIAQTLPSYRRITDFAVVRQPLPRTSLGKIRRFRLPELYRGAKAGRLGARPGELSAEDGRLLEAERAGRVWDGLPRRFPDKPVGMDASLAVDLGIDSLDWVALTLDLQEAAGVALTEEAVAGIGSVRDLLRAAVAAPEAGMEAAGGALTPEQARLLEPPGPGLHLLGSALSGVNRAAFAAAFPLTVRGRENVPAKGRLLFAPNHLSFLDPFAIAAALPREALRRTWWAGFSGLLHSSAPRRLFSRATQVFPVNEQAPASSLAFGRTVLERGDNLVWFPEGARSTDGTLMPFMPGIGLLIEQAEPTVVPVFIRGSWGAWPRGRALPRPHRLSVSFGRPLAPDTLAAMGDGPDRRARIVSGLRRAVLELAQD